MFVDIRSEPFEEVIGERQRTLITLGGNHATLAESFGLTLHFAVARNGNQI